jgi:hypothetical protein
MFGAVCRWYGIKIDEVVSGKDFIQLSFLKTIKEIQIPIKVVEYWRYY